jgi:carboxyl-terminal processing protease
LIGAVIVLVLAAELHGRSQNLAGVSVEDRENVILFAKALEVVREDYVDREATDPEKLTYAAISGMLDSLGDERHTYFMTPEETEEKPGVSSTWPVSIGLQLEDKGDEIAVSVPLDDSPTKEAGLEPGDILIAVDGESVEGEDITEVSEKFEGSEGSTVELTVLRDEEERGFSVERVKLDEPAVTWNPLPDTDVAHLRLARFSKNSASELEKAIYEARDAGARSFVLDLRDNPGGWARQAERVAALFLLAGSPIYIQRDSDGEEEETTLLGGDDTLDAPLVVLVNEGTASSAEILAGALKENGRAKLVGERTSGIGTVIEDYPLGNGSAVLLSVAEWLTLKGNPNQWAGIPPDIETELEDGQEPRFPDEVRGLSRAEILSKDAQLKRASVILREE